MLVEKADGVRLAVIARRAEAPEIQMVLRCSKAPLLHKMSSLSWRMKSPRGCVPERMRARQCPDRGHQRGKDAGVKDAWDREPFGVVSVAS